VHHNNPRSYTAENTALEVQFEVDAEDDLAKEEEAKVWSERGVDVM